MSAEVSATDKLAAWHEQHAEAFKGPEKWRRDERERHLTTARALRTKAAIERLRPDQIAFANHCLSSWNHRIWHDDERAITIEGNAHIPIVQKAVRLTLERQP